MSPYLCSLCTVFNYMIKSYYFCRIPASFTTQFGKVSSEKNWDLENPFFIQCQNSVLSNLQGYPHIKHTSVAQFRSVPRYLKHQVIYYIIFPTKPHPSCQPLTSMDNRPYIPITLFHSCITDPNTTNAHMLNLT